MAKRLLVRIDGSICAIKKRAFFGQFVSSVLNRCLSQHSEVERIKKGTSLMEEKEVPQPSAITEPNDRSVDPGVCSDSSSDDELSGRKWKLELAWLSRALEPALQLYKWASTSENYKQRTPPSSRSLVEILTHLQRSKTGFQDWSLSDLAVGLLLTYLRQAAADKVEDIRGLQISSDLIVQDLMYHVELAKGAYKESAAGLARHSMLRERNVLKFVKDSSVMRPGYYIGTDIRNKLVILGIRGTHTVYDLITDMVSSSDQEVSLEGFSTHFGTAEAARWFLQHEIGTIRKCLEKHKGFKLRLVGHSLGGAAAALLAIMLREKSAEELGFDPDIVSSVGFGTPPCVSKKLAESCSTFVSTIVLQDDIVPRLSAASLTRLRNEILQTDWISVLEKEDWKSIIDIVANAKQLVSLVQDVARKLSDYTRFRRISNASGISVREKQEILRDPSAIPVENVTAITKSGTDVPEELFAPGSVYFLNRKREKSSITGKEVESYTLWKRQPGEHFRRILLSGDFISDHKCDNHYYALRDVLKGLPAST